MKMFLGVVALVLFSFFGGYFIAEGNDKGEKIYIGVVTAMIFGVPMAMYAIFQAFGVL